MLKRSVGAEAKRRLIYLDPSEIRMSEKDKSDISGLTESIRHNGLLCPLTVRRGAFGYELVCGHRRYRACVAAGMRKLPCLLVSADDKARAVMKLTENIHRSDTDPFVLAEKISDAMRDYNMSSCEIAGRLGVSRNELAKLLGLLKYDDSVRESLLNESTRVSRAEDQNEKPRERAREDTVPTRKPPHKVAVGDVRFFINSFNRVVAVMREAGYVVSSVTSEHDDTVEFTVKAGKSPAAASYNRQLPLSM